MFRRKSLLFLAFVFYIVVVVVVVVVDLPPYKIRMRKKPNCSGDQKN